MASKLKKIGIALSILLILFLIVGFFANPFLENKIQLTLEKSFPKAYHLKYGKISANVWLGNLSISKINLRKDSSKIKIDAVHLKGVSWLTYLKTKQLDFKTLEVIQPDIRYIESTTFFDPKTQNDSLKPSEFGVSIDNISIENAEFTRLDSTAELSTHHLNTMHLRLKDFVIDSLSRLSKIPFRYSSIDLNIDSISALVGEFEIMHAKHFKLNDKKVSFENMVFKTKYPKAKYNQLLKKERDHYDIHVERLNLKGWTYAFQKDSLSMTIKHVNLEHPNAIIYRNKLLKDDNSQKKFYGEALRTLPFKLGVENLTIHNAELKYQEKVLPKQPPGELIFNSINADILSLGNIYKKEVMDIVIEAKFMNSANLKVDWQYWVNKKNEKFRFRTRLSQLQAKNINSFTKPTQSVGFSGNIKQTFFSIYGNKYSSNIDMQMEYDNFKVELFNTGKRRKSTIKSAIANIFISKKSSKKEERFKKVKAQAKPNRSKSFFNYIWRNIKIALLKTFKDK